MTIGWMMKKTMATTIAVGFSVLLLGCDVVGVNEDDDEEVDTTSGMCFYECENDLESMESPVSRTDCEAAPGEDPFCEGLLNRYYAEGCTECEACAPDWFEC